MTLSPPKTPEPPPLPPKKVHSSDSSARVLGSLGVAVLTLLLYPAISLSYSWGTKAPSAPAAGVSYRMDLAQADLGELLLIPGFGETLANRWLQERDALVAKHGDPLVAIGELRGIGPQKLKVIRQYAISSTSANIENPSPKSKPKSP